MQVGQCVAQRLVALHQFILNFLQRQPRTHFAKRFRNVLCDKIKQFQILVGVSHTGFIALRDNHTNCLLFHDQWHTEPVHIILVAKHSLQATATNQLRSLLLIQKECLSCA